MPGHLTKEERDRLAQLHHQGFAQVEIAAALKRSPGTISRELKRNRTGSSYFATLAQDLAQRRRRERPLQRKMDLPELSQAVRTGLIRYWSPDQIAGRLKCEFPENLRMHLCPQTIYTWIGAQPKEDRKHWQSFLRRRGKRPWSRRETTNPADSRTALADRPAVIEQRRRLGDFEGDTVLGPPGSGGVVTLVDRQSRFTIVSKVPCKQAPRVHQKIKDRLKVLNPSQRTSITFDNGTEFARCHLLEKHLGIKIYFAQPGCPYQRGTNENTNGLIRQFFPKGMDFREVSHQEVREVENLLNNRPRACLGYRTPNEVFHANSATSRCN
jgi:IS30 family transposase